MKAIAIDNLTVFFLHHFARKYKSVLETIYWSR